MMPDVTIITITHNSRAVVGRLLDSLDAPEAPVIAVDNGSTDDTRTVMAAYPQVRVVSAGNIGYGRGANLGIAQAATPYVLLVNPDVVFAPGAIAAMHGIMARHPDIGILGAQMSDAKPQDFDGEGLAYTGWIVGALMLIRRDAFMKLGMFDDNIFLFYEETDLCKRFADAGYKLAITNRATALHEAGSSSPASLQVLKIKAWHGAWSKAYYYRKHFSRITYARKCTGKLIYAVCRLCRGVYRRNPRDIIKNYYEFLGLTAYLAGKGAFDGDAGRLT